jgi:RNA polymerase sigma factor (sigma-70 family)
VRACLAGDPAARRAFQDRFAEDIYNFPVKIYGVDAERAADFYLYVFERDRVFARLRTFEGRNNIQFRTFLAYYVLRALFLEWQRGHRELVTVSLSAPLEQEEGERTLEDVLPAPPSRPDPGGPPAAGSMADLWGALAPEERLDLKLLSLLEHDLTPDDLRLLARVSRRSLRETVAVVHEVLDELRKKDVALARLREELDSAWGWIVLRRRELQDTRERLGLLPPDDDSPARARLVERQRQLEDAIAKRVRQRERLLEEIRSFKATTPYKDIARLLRSTVGTVCSRIFRLRQRLEQRWPPGKEAVS